MTTQQPNSKAQTVKSGQTSQPKEWRRDINPSLLRILDGTLAAIARHGTSMLSMTDIAAASGVSRATLYRYFSQKEDLLSALGEHISGSFISGVERAAAGQQQPLEILRAVVEFIVEFTAQAKADRQLEVEPQFVLGFLRAHFAEHVDAVTSALAPCYEYLEGRFGFAVDRRALTETLLRFSESTSLVPGGALWHALPTLLPAAIEVLLGGSARPRKIADTDVEFAQ